MNNNNYNSYNNQYNTNEPKSYNSNYDNSYLNNNDYYDSSSNDFNNANNDMPFMRNNNMNNSYDMMNSNEPLPFNSNNTNQNVSPTFAKATKIIGWIIAIPIILMVILGIVTVIFALTSISKITNEVNNLSVASYSDKITVNAKLKAYYSKNDDIYYEHYYEDSTATDSNVNNSSYDYNNNVNIIPARIRSHSSSSSDDDYSRGLDIEGTVTNNDNKQHTVTVVFNALKPTNEYNGMCFQTFDLKAGETKTLDDVSCNIKNNPIMNVSKPVIKDGGSTGWSMSSTSGSKYQDDWDK